MKNMLLLCFLLCFGAVYGNDFVFAAKDKGLNIGGKIAFNARGALKMDGKNNVIYHSYNRNIFISDFVHAADSRNFSVALCGTARLGACAQAFFDDR